MKRNRDAPCFYHTGHALYNVFVVDVAGYVSARGMDWVVTREGHNFLFDFLVTGTVFNFPSACKQHSLTTSSVSLAASSRGVCLARFKDANSNKLIDICAYFGPERDSHLKATPSPPLL
jgi:hypothetical protein